MGLKEDFQNYQQRREAKRYFRSNNDAFLSPQKTLLMALSCLGIATVLQLIVSFIFSMISIQFSIEYIIIAYFVTMTIRSFTTTPRITTTIIGIITYIIGTLLGKLIFLSFALYSPSFLLGTGLFAGMFLILINQGMMTTLFLLIGAFYIYYYTK